MTESVSVNRTVTPNQAKAAIRKCFNVNRPVFLWGAPGIGKSDIVKQIAEERGREVVDVRLSLWEPTDIKGIPFFNPETRRMEWAPPIELPQDPESTAVLFLDELNSSAPATQAAAYQLILNRRVGTYVLPKNVSIVAAGNRESDKGVTYRMPAPLANRFLHLELKVNFDDYQEWAVKNKIHDQVLGYLNFKKQDLNDFDPRSASRAFATPRSWSFVSDLIADDDLSDDTLTDLISGAVGDGIALKFMAHRKIAKQLPNPVSVLKGKVDKMEIKEISAMYSLTISLCYELQTAYEKKEKDWNDQADNFFRFMMDNFPTEIVVMGAKVALTQYGLPFDASKLKSFDDFYNKYGRYVITAMETDR
jgi:hypothetical protein